jgi:hypothetical protein
VPSFLSVVPSFLPSVPSLSASGKAFLRAKNPVPTPKKAGKQAVRFRPIASEVMQSRLR